MWELICHHTYKWRGLAVDLSPHRSNGVVDRAVFQADGAATGSGALSFTGPHALMRIPIGPELRRVRGMKSNASSGWMPLGRTNTEC